MYYGVSGSGKTYKVKSTEGEENIYLAKYGNSGPWFDGYEPRIHKVLLLDEFAG